MKWLILLTFISLNSHADSSREKFIQLKTSSKSNAHLREAQRSLASVDPALKPIKILKMKAKPLLLIRD